MDGLPFRALMVATLISRAGGAVTILAVPWYVHQTTGSAALTGLAAAASVGASVIGAFFGGSLADRFDRKRVSLVADLLSGAAIAAVPALAGLGHLSTWSLLSLVFLGALLDAPGGAARFAMTPALAELAGVPLSRANSLVSAMTSAAEMLGLFLAGVVLTVTSPAGALYIDAATFGVSLVITLVVIPTGLGGDNLLEDEFAWTSFLEGARFLRSDRLVRTLGYASFATNFLGAPLFAVIMVEYLSSVTGGALSLGAVLAVGGVGLTVGAVAFTRWGGALPRRAVFLVAFAGFGLQYWPLAMRPSVAAIAVVFTVRGFLTSPYNPVASTLLHERVPRRLLGSVFGAIGAIGIVGEPIGLVAGGQLVEHAGLQTAIIAVGVGYAIVTALLIASPAVRAMGGPKPAHEAGDDHSTCGDTPQMPCTTTDPRSRYIT
jgi:MFS family permease